MKKLTALACVVVAAGCYNFEQDLLDCSQSGPCDFVAADGGAVDGGDVDGGGGVGGGGGTGGGSGGGGGGSGDAGPIICPPVQLAAGSPCPAIRPDNRYCAGDWCWEHPRQPSTPIWGLHNAGGALWTVGANGTFGCFDGTGWSYAYTPNDDGLFAVHGVASDLTMVSERAAIFRFRDGGLTTEAAPACGGELHDVWTSGALRLAVGYDNGTYVCETTGGPWRKVIPQGASTNIGLHAIDGLDVGTIYAAGDLGTVLSRLPDGGWQKVTAPVMSDGGAPRLRAVWIADAGEVHVGGEGYHGALSVSQGAWTEYANPPDPQVTSISGRRGSFPVRIAGVDPEICDPSTTSCVRSSNGVQVSVWSIDVDETGKMWAAGSSGYVCSSADGSNWQSLTPDDLPPLFAVKARSLNDVWAVGIYSEILRKTGDCAWEELSAAPYIETFNGLALEPDGGVWIAGTEGLYFHDGVTLTQVPVLQSDGGTPRELGTIVTAAGGRIWAAGRDGVIIRIDPGAAPVLVSDTGPFWRGSTALRDGGVLLLGDASKVRFIHGLTFTDESVPYANAELNTAADTDRGDIYAFGEGWEFGFKRGPDAGWAQLPFNAASPIEGTYRIHDTCSDGVNIWFVDNDGRMRKLPPAGKSTAIRQPVGAALYGLECIGNEAYAVGDHAAIIRGTLK